MFRCIPCLSTGGLLEDVTRHMKCMLSREDDHQAQPMQSSGSSPNSATTMLDEMAEATRRLKNKRKKKKKRKQQQQKVAMGSDGHAEAGPEEKKGGEEEIMEEYWVSEVDRGVLITFLSLPGGGNSINKIHFRKEMFDASEAKMWWDENCDMIRNLYSIQGKHASPPQADNVSPSISAQEGSQRQMETNSVYNSVSSTLSRPAPSGKTSPGRHPEKGTAVPAKLVEWVIEDQPGVLVTVRCLPDGSKELRRVQLSCERFGEVKARAWWEENKERLHRQYT